MKPIFVPDLVTLGWVHDLCEPCMPGLWHSRQGYSVEVCEEDFLYACRERAEGADEVYFEAVRTEPFDGANYILYRAPKGP
jgi:hypothetical protein